MTIPPVRAEGLDKFVDKVAKAIHFERHFSLAVAKTMIYETTENGEARNSTWTMLDLSEQDDYRNTAYAAIIATLEAIREPTQDQVNAGRRNMPTVVNKSMSSRYPVQESYRAMINQLIKEIEQ